MNALTRLLPRRLPLSRLPPTRPQPPRLLPVRLLLPLLLVSPPLVAQDAPISGFTGSETLGTYEARFAELPLLVMPLADRNVPTTEVVEGALVSTIYRRPEGVTPFEVYRSYLSTLEEGGFEILLDCRAPDCNIRLSMSPTYRPVLGSRAYGRLPTGTLVYLDGWVEHYISARKALPGGTVYAMILISRERGLYSVDVLETAEREVGTVTLSEELLGQRLEDEGKSVLDGLYFETGSDVITPASDATLATITSYLQANPDERYYVVGHTDDTGAVAGNLSLSDSRARAVIAALADRGIPAGRLDAWGAGPYVPVASNRSETGRSANRRVELVLRLAGG